MSEALTNPAVTFALGLIASLLGVFVWHYKRRVQNAGESERVELASRKIQHDKEMFNLLVLAREAGLEFNVFEQDFESLRSSATSKEQLIDAVERMAFGEVDNEYSHAFSLEAVITNPECLDELVDLSRQRFVHVFRRMTEHYPIVIEPVPEVRRRCMFAYYHWIENPNEANHDAWITAVRSLSKAIEEGQIGIAER